MLEVVLTYSTDDGIQEISLENERTSFGRGSEADYRVADDGLSRLHATVYREGDRIWVVDENSTNGTYVNGEKVSSSGTILRNGDAIKIGHYTTIRVKIFEKQFEEKAAKPAAAVNNSTKAVAASGSSQSSFGVLTIVITTVAFLIIAASAIFIGFKAFGNNGTDVVYTPGEEFGTPNPRDTSESEDTNKDKKSPTPKPEKTAVNSNSGSNTVLSDLPGGNTINNPISILNGRKYQQLNDDEKNRYIAAKAEKVAQIIGNQKSEPIPSDAIQTIKSDVNAYLTRIRTTRKDDCSQGSWTSSDLLSVLDRATKTSPFIVRDFNAGSIEPVIGLYVAMIESEHCPCLTSKTGAVGMFQFLPKTAPDYGLSADQRCDPEAASKAAANYLKSLIGRFGTAPDSVPLAIASYNSGQGNLGKNLDKVFSAAASQNRSFWTLAANKGVMEGTAGEQFNRENIKYVPKFFATAIIGENPQDFGINMKPLSLYR